MTPFIKQTLFTIDSNDFDNFVMSKYGGNFKFVTQHEANNDSDYSFNAPNVAMFFKDEATDIRNGNYKSHSVHQIFQVLYEDGFIEKGDYIVKVFW